MSDQSPIEEDVNHTDRIRAPLLRTKDDIRERLKSYAADQFDSCERRYIDCIIEVAFDCVQECYPEVDLVFYYQGDPSQTRRPLAAEFSIMIGSEKYAWIQPFHCNRPPMMNEMAELSCDCVEAFERAEAKYVDR